MHSDKMISRKDGGVGWMIFNNPERHNAVSAAPKLVGSGSLSRYEAPPALRFSMGLTR